jgi:hypothetical protein
MPRLKAAIYWHERWQNEDGYYSNLRIYSSPESLEEYKKQISQPEWVTQPQLETGPPSHASMPGSPKPS